MSLFRRGLSWLLRPLHRFLVVRTTVADPWEPATSFLITHHRFGMGSARPFSWYFEGTSTVAVSSVEEICDWLAHCQYVRDPVLFREPDYWQHPLTFEQLRKGDCEDYALWAWRKLHELGIPAELYVGQWQPQPDRGGFHAWVVFEQAGHRYVMEPATKEPGRAVSPFDKVRDNYVPHFSVDASFRMCARAGLLLSWRNEELARRTKRSSDAA